MATSTIPPPIAALKELRDALRVDLVGHGEELMNVWQLEDHAGRNKVPNDSFFNALQPFVTLTDSDKLDITRRFADYKGLVRYSKFVNWLKLLPPADFVDPLLQVDPLPMPFRLINKVVEDVFDEACEEIRARQSRAGTRQINPKQAKRDAAARPTDSQTKMGGSDVDRTVYPSYHVPDMSNMTSLGATANGKRLCVGTNDGAVHLLEISERSYNLGGTIQAFEKSSTPLNPVLWMSDLASVDAPTPLLSRSVPTGTGPSGDIMPTTTDVEQWIATLAAALNAKQCGVGYLNVTLFACGSVTNRKAGPEIGDNTSRGNTTTSLQAATTMNEENEMKESQAEEGEANADQATEGGAEVGKSSSGDNQMSDEESETFSEEEVSIKLYTLVPPNAVDMINHATTAASVPQAPGQPVRPISSTAMAKPEWFRLSGELLWATNNRPGRRVKRITLSPDGKFLAVHLANGEVAVFVVPQACLHPPSPPEQQPEPGAVVPPAVAPKPPACVTLTEENHLAFVLAPPTQTPVDVGSGVINDTSGISGVTFAGLSNNVMHLEGVRSYFKDQLSFDREVKSRRKESSGGGEGGETEGKGSAAKDDNAEGEEKINYGEEFPELVGFSYSQDTLEATEAVLSQAQRRRGGLANIKRSSNHWLSGINVQNIQFVLTAKVQTRVGGSQRKPQGVCNSMWVWMKGSKILKRIQFEELHKATSHPCWGMVPQSSAPTLNGCAVTRKWILDSPIECTAVDCSTTLLATGLRNGSVTLWDGSMGEERMLFCQMLNPCRHIAFYQQQYLIAVSEPNPNTPAPASGTVAVQSNGEDQEQQQQQQQQQQAKQKSHQSANEHEVLPGACSFHVYDLHTSNPTTTYQSRLSQKNVKSLRLDGGLYPDDIEVEEIKNAINEEEQELKQAKDSKRLNRARILEAASRQKKKKTPIKGLACTTRALVQQKQMKENFQSQLRKNQDRDLKRLHRPPLPPLRFREKHLFLNDYTSFGDVLGIKCLPDCPIVLVAQRDLDKDDDVPGAAGGAAVQETNHIQMAVP